MTEQDIVERLTDAQKRALLAARGPDADQLYWFALGSARGLPVELKQRTVIGHCFTPLGLSVRKLLEKQNG